MPKLTNGSVLKQLEKTDYLVVSARTQKPTVNDRLAKADPEIFGAGSGEAPSAPDWDYFQEWGIAALEQSSKEVRQTDRDLRKSRVRLKKARRDRNRAAKIIFAGHRSLRTSFKGTHGPESLALVGLEEEPAAALQAAREQMSEAVGRMRDPQLAGELPPPLAGQRPIDLESVADARAAELDDFDARMDEIDELRKQTDEALVVRNEALARGRRVYANVGRLLEGVYRLAGLDELADRIRVTRRASRKKEEEPESPEASAEQPAQPESPQPEEEGGDAS